MATPINSGKLTSKYRIPPYAQEMLYLVTSDRFTPVQGPQGNLDTFSVNGLARLNWGTPKGPTLVFWDSVASSSDLHWDGHVKIGGFIERLHALEVGGLEVVIAEVVGGPVALDNGGLPSLDDMRQGVFARPSDIEPLDKDRVYPFIILAESNLAALAQDALVSGIAVDAHGSLADEGGKWHETVGLPLLLESLTLLAP
jgi:hypothetical protein